MKKIVFLAHEFGLFPGHGGVASYLDILVNQILDRNEDYEVHVFAYVYDKKNAAFKSKRFKINTIKGNNLHEQAINILKHLIKLKPDFVECTDYLALGLESLVYKYQTDKNELSDTVFITLHHTASRECFEWNDRISVKYANEFIKECFARERVQMKLSDLNVAPSSFMNMYVSKNYALKDVQTILHPLMIKTFKKSDLLNEMERDFDISMFKGKFIINCISRIEGRKNQMLLVDQFMRFVARTGANALLFIVGNSSVNSVTGRNFKNEIYETIPNEFKNKILFFDFMNTKEKKRILALSDLSVLASPFECLSLALTESVSDEIPVLCSKYCGFADYMSEFKYEMTFDPFKENDLCEKITAFYNATEKHRAEIMHSQLDNIIDRASFVKTIDYRLELYEKTHEPKKAVCKSQKALIIDESNYFKIVDEDVLAEGYDSILVHFYFNKYLVNTLEKWFYKISAKFDSGDIICYSGGAVKLCYINALLESKPFFINDIKFTEKNKGMCFADLVSEYVSSNSLIYSLMDMIEGLDDSVKNPPSKIVCKKREDFSKYLISKGFYSENLIDLEERIKNENKK